MSDINDGGPAFPATVDGNGQFVQTGVGTFQTSGMSLRDYFAANAMKSLLARGYVGDENNSGTPPSDYSESLDSDCVVGPNTLAEDAHRIADAMIRVRAMEAKP